MYRIFPQKFLTLAVFVHVDEQQYLTPARVSGLSANQISHANSSGSIISSSERQMKTYFSHDHHVDVLPFTNILPCLFNACYSTSFNGPKIGVCDIAYTSEVYSTSFNGPKISSCDIAYTSEVRFSAILVLMTAIN
jgi:hypothetical protein